MTTQITRFYRRETHIVNYLTARQLTLAQGTTSDVLSAASADNIVSDMHTRTSDGTETLRGSNIARVDRTENGAGLQGATWTAPCVTLALTDALVLTEKIRAGDTELTSERWISEQLNQPYWAAAEWQLYRYTERSGTDFFFRFGDATFNSRLIAPGLFQRAQVSGSSWNGATSVAWSPNGGYVAVASYLADAVEVLEFTGTSLVSIARLSGANWDGARGVAWSPDGRYIAVASKEADALEVLEFTGTSLDSKARISGGNWDGARGVAWSPNGRYVAVASETADAVEVLEFTGTSLDSKARVSGSNWDGAAGVAWSPNGGYVAVVSPSAQAVEVLEFTGTSLNSKARLSGANWFYAISVAWSPNGGYVAVASYLADAVEVLEFTGTSLVSIARLSGANWDGAAGVAWSPDGRYVALTCLDGNVVEVFEFTGTSLVSMARLSCVTGPVCVNWHPSGEYIVIAINPVPSGVEVMEFVPPPPPELVGNDALVASLEEAPANIVINGIDVCDVFVVEEAKLEVSINETFVAFVDEIPSLVLVITLVAEDVCNTFQIEGSILTISAAEAFSASLDESTVIEPSESGLTNVMRDFYQAAVIGESVTPFNAANAHIGVGDSAATFDATQTDLQADTNKVRVPMDDGYPQRFGNSIIFRSTFGPNDANFPWNEWGVFNASTGGVIMIRWVENLGTKALGTTWVLTIELLLHIGEIISL